MGPELGLSQSMAEAASATLAGLPAPLPEVLLPDTFTQLQWKREPDMGTFEFMRKRRMPSESCCIHDYDRQRSSGEAAADATLIRNSDWKVARSSCYSERQEH